MGPGANQNTSEHTHFYSQQHFSSNSATGQCARLQLRTPTTRLIAKEKVHNTKHKEQNPVHWSDFIERFHFIASRPTLHNSVNVQSWCLMNKCVFVNEHLRLNGRVELACQMQIETHGNLGQIKALKTLLNVKAGLVNTFL